MQKTLAAAFLAVALIPARAQALENEELLALVAMPLAVAAVSEVTDVPVSDLVDVVTLMNDAAVPPAQFIEVLRYAPVALVVEAQPAEPSFADFVRVQYDNGLRGSALVNTIEERFQIYGVEGVDLDVSAPRIVDVDERFLPPVVVTRLAERKSHPHGGPPGQLKKERGLKTGAEVVHGSKRAVVRDADDDNDRAVVREKKVKRENVSGNRGRGHSIEKHHGNGPKHAAGGGNHGGGHGGGKGKGKGKG